MSDVADTVPLDIRKQGLQPGAVEPPLTPDMVEQLLAAGG